MQFFDTQGSTRMSWRQGVNWIKPLFNPYCRVDSNWWIVLYSAGALVLSQLLYIKIIKNPDLINAFLEEGVLQHLLGQKMRLEFSPLILTYAWLIAPVLEELAWRGFLIVKRTWVATSSGTLLFIVTASILPDSTSFWMIIIRLLLMLGTASLIYFTLSENFLQFLARKRLTCYTGSSLLFGLYHILNFNPLLPTTLAMAPLLILPQLVAGFIFGYVRVQRGLFHAIVLHALNNLFFVRFV